MTRDTPPFDHVAPGSIVRATGTRPCRENGTSDGLGKRTGWLLYGSWGNLVESRPVLLATWGMIFPAWFLPRKGGNSACARGPLGALFRAPPITVSFSR